MNIGCYGSIFCHDEQNKICSECDVRIACQEVASKAISKIREELDVEHIARKFEQMRVKNGTIDAISQPAASRKRVKLTEKQKLIVSNEKFPIKARKMAASVFRKGIDGIFIRKMISAKSNPFRNATPAIMEIGCDLLINGSLTMENMSREILKRSNNRTSPKSASSQASTVIMALVIMGVVVPINRVGKKEFVMRGSR